MDPSLITKLPIFKKIMALFTLLALVEIAIIVVTGIFFGFDVVVVELVVSMLIGYSITPSTFTAQKPNPGLAAGFTIDQTTARKWGGRLLMIPGALSDIVGLLILLPPVRNGVSALAKKYAAKKMQSMGMGGLDPEMLANMAKNMGMGGGANPFGGMGANPYAGMGAGANPFGAGFGAQHKADESKSGSKTHSEQRRAKRARNKQTTTVDVDYEVRDGDGVWIGGKSESPTDLVVAMKHDKAPEPVEADVIDIQGEWK